MLGGFSAGMRGNGKSISDPTTIEVTAQST